MTWEKHLDIIRSGNTVIPTAQSGIPKIAVNAPHGELIQLMAALTAGYNRNAERIKSLRELAKPMIEKEADNVLF